MQSETYKSRSGETLRRPVISEHRMWASMDDGSGFCLACGHETEGVEPDARKYTCDSCGKPTVYGLPELIMMGIAKVKAGKHN